MKVEFHTLSWTNSDPRLVESQRKVMSSFGIDVNYSIVDMRHGLWMDGIMQTTTAEVVGFFDSDCVPLRKDAADEAIKYVAANETFLGTAQASNHISPRSHIYASPGFFFISKSAYDRLGHPSFAETSRSDVGQELCRIAENSGLRYRAIYPSFYEREPDEGIWHLGNYGFFGIGTVFEDLAYHLYQGRMKKHVDLFAQRCDEIIQGVFSTNGMKRSRDFSAQSVS